MRLFKNTSVVVMTILLLTVFTSLSFSLENVIFIETVIYLNDTLEVVDYGVIEGRVSSYPPGEYSYVIYDNKGNIALSGNFSVPALEFYNNASVLLKLPYSQEFSKVEIFHGNIKLGEINIDLCDNDGVCEQKENFLSCPKDCPPGSEDGYCDMVRDRKIDPDCYPGEDPDEYCNYNGKCEPELNESEELCSFDCNPTNLEDVVSTAQENKNLNVILYVILLVIVIIVIFVVLIFIKRRKSTAYNQIT